MEDVMTYKTILVSLNEIPRLPQLIDAAARLGGAFDAHVTGLYVVPAVQFYPSVGYEAMPQYFDGNQVYFKDHARAAEEAFTRTMSANGVRHEFELANGASPDVADDVVARGRCADLILLSSISPDQPAGVEPDFVEQIVISSGRPVIILPVAGEARLNMDRVVLAWDGGREAARAAFDATPLLKMADRVFITRIDPQKERGLKNAVPGIDLAEMLARHGIKAEVKNISAAGEDAGHALITCASDEGCGLIVMGAYGHSRLREYIFGGTTRHMLQSMDRPVLMSH
jgi:nucleotide-binding universal stress UspA family protein